MKIPEHWYIHALRDTLTSLTIEEFLEVDPDVEHKAAIKLFELFEPEEILKMEGLSNMVREMMSEKAEKMYQEYEKERHLAAKEDLEKD